MQKEVDELRSEGSASKLALEAAQRELADSKAQLEAEAKRSQEAKAGKTQSFPLRQASHRTAVFG